MIYNLVNGEAAQKFLKVNDTLLPLTPQQFTCDAGLTITLDNSFRLNKIPTQTFYAEAKIMLFLASKETFTTLSALGITTNSTIEDYARILFQAQHLTVTLQFDQQNNLYYFVYEKVIAGKNFHYYAVIVKGSDAFWLCQFACESNLFADLRPYFVDCAKTITVA